MSNPPPQPQGGLDTSPPFKEKALASGPSKAELVENWRGRMKGPLISGPAPNRQEHTHIHTKPSRGDWI